MNRPGRRSLPAHDAGTSPMAGRSADASKAGPWATMLTAFSALALAGCATVEYYAQSAAGHLGLMYRARPIETVIAAPDTEPRLAARLRTALDVLDFASDAAVFRDVGGAALCLWCRSHSAQ